MHTAKENSFKAAAFVAKKLLATHSQRAVVAIMPSAALHVLQLRRVVQILLGSCRRNREELLVKTGTLQRINYLGNNRGARCDMGVRMLAQVEHDLVCREAAGQGASHALARQHPHE